jgi:hypothetical protein
MGGDGKIRMLLRKYQILSEIPLPRAPVLCLSAPLYILFPRF